METYRWVFNYPAQGHDYVYHTTADIAKTPVGFFDVTAGIIFVFKTMRIVTPNMWPSGQFVVPEICD